jgi:dTDP-4-dehydrorhamnose 3,5-epimerase
VSRGEFFELAIHKENYCRLKVPPEVWFAFEGQAPGLNLLLNIASIEHDPDEAQNMELNTIAYDW